MRNDINKNRLFQVNYLQLLQSCKIKLKSLTLIQLLLICAYFFPLTLGHCQEPKLSFPLQYTLANGLKVILLKENSLPVVSVQMWYQSGSVNERTGKTGLAHLTEHMLFKKLGNLRSNEIGLILARAGIKYNAATSQDFTTFYELGTKNNLKLMLNTESLRMKEAKFTQTDLNIEKNNIYKDIQAQINDNQKLLTSEIEACAYQRHPYQNPLCGMAEDIEKITLADIENFYKSNFIPNNATLIIVGDFNKASTINLIEKLFSPISKGKITHHQNLANPSILYDHRICIHKPAKQNVINFAYRAPKATDKLAVSELVMENLIDNELKKHLNQPNALLKNYDCTYNLRHEPGLFTISLTTTNDTSINNLENELANIFKSLNNTSTQDLTRAKNAAYFNLANEFTGPYELAFELGLCQSYGDWNLVYKYLAEINTVTNNDIKNLLTTYFNSNNRIIAYVSPGSDTNPKINQITSISSNQGKPVSKNISLKKTNSKESTDNNAKHVLKPSKISSKKTTPKTNTVGKHRTKVLHYEESEINNEINIDENIHPENNSFNSTLENETVNSQLTSNLKLTNLKNNVKLLVLTNKLSPLVCLTGSIGDTNELNNKNIIALAKFYVYLLNNPNLIDKNDSSNQIQDDLGIDKSSQLHFFIENGKLCYKIVFLAQNVNLVLPILKHRLEINWSKDLDLDKYKTNFSKILANEYNSIAQVTNDSVLRALINKDSIYYPLFIDKLIKNLNNIKIEDLKDFQNNLLNVKPKLIVFTGLIENTQAIDYTNNYLGNLKANQNSNQSIKLKIAQPTILKSTVFTHLYENKKILANFSRLINCDSSINDLLANLYIADCALVTHPIYAKLNKPVFINSQKQNLFNEINSKIQYLPDFLLWSLSMPLNKTNYKTTLNSLKIEMANFTKSFLTNDELKETKKYLSNTLPIALQNNIITASLSLLQPLAEKTTNFELTNLINSINQVNLTNLNKFVVNKFYPQKSSLIILETREKN